MDRQRIKARLLTFVGPAVVLGVAGCSSGRVGGVYVLDGAVAVEDAVPDWQQTVVVKDGRAIRLRGTLVPTTAATSWLVVDESIPVMHMLRTSKMRA